MMKTKNSVAGKRARMPPHMPRGVKLPLWWDLAKRFQQSREAAGLTFQEIQEWTGIDNGGLSALERGHHTPRIDTAERVAAALGVSPCWLAFGEDGHKPFQPRFPRHGIKPTLPHSEGPQPIAGLFEGCALRLRTRRLAFGLSVRQLALHAGVSHQTVGNIEKGRQVPRVDSVHRLSVSLDVAPCWLAYGIGQKPGRVKRESHQVVPKAAEPSSS